jgi:antitoxin component YwqK of YwqJK toxin-antitoxin module
MNEVKFGFFRILIIMFFCQSLLAQTDYNKLDEKGKKHGVWKGFYEESKRQRYEGTFEHGREIGVFNYYDDTKAKSIIATRTFSSKDNSAYTVFYNQKKNIVSEGKVVNKLFEGEWKYYHEDSKVIMTLENYKKGKLDGLRTVFYPSAKIADKTNYVNGIKQGLYLKYSENGIVLEEVNYNNGELDGLATYKDPQGNIVAQGNYKAGKKSGIWKFYENGKLINEENMSFPKKIKKQKN